MMMKPAMRPPMRAPLRSASAPREGVGGYSRVVLLGTSITGQNTSTDQYNSHGYWGVANSIAGWAMRLLYNAGVSGNGTDQMLARLSTDVLAYSPDIVIGEGGTNDPGRGISAAQCIQNLTDIFTQLRAGGVKCIVWGTITPRSDQAGALLTFIQTVNAWLRTTPLIDACPDYYAAWADPGNSDQPYANYTYDSSPRLHPSPRGATAMGVELASKVRPFLSSPLAINTDELNYREYGFNPIGAGDNAGGSNGWTLVTGVTGNGPDGWSARRRATGTGVASKAAGDIPQIVASFAADRDGAGFVYGSDDVLGLGRYDIGWSASQTVAKGARRRPTVANGYTYRCVVPGQTGGSQPTWPTTEGALVADNTAVWLCQRMPQAGDIFRGMAAVAFSDQAASKWAIPVLALSAFDTAAASIGNVAGLWYDVSGGIGVGPDNLPLTLIVTPELTLQTGTGTIRHLRNQLLVYGQSGGNVTMSARQSIWRVSP